MAGGTTDDQLRQIRDALGELNLHLGGMEARLGGVERRLAGMEHRLEVRIEANRDAIRSGRAALDLMRTRLERPDDR